MARQRWLATQLCKGGWTFLCAEADGWEAQHSQNDMRSVVESAYALLSRLSSDESRASLRKAVYNAVRLHLNQRVQAGGQVSHVITSLLSGDDFTQLVKLGDMTPNHAS